MITEWNHRENLHVDPHWDWSSLVSQQLLCSLSINQWFYKRPNRTYTIKKSVKFFLINLLPHWDDWLFNRNIIFLKLTYIRRLTCPLVQLNGKRLHCKWSIAFGQCFWHFTFALILKGREKHLTPAVSS